MKEIKYEKELFVPHKKFTTDELNELGVRPSSEVPIFSERYILCKYEHEHKNVSLDNYVSQDNIYHAVYDTKTNEFVMFNDETESAMGPWLVLTEPKEIGLPGLNIVCYSNYDYDSMDDTNDTWWNESVLYGVFDDDGNIHRGAMYNHNGQLNIIETNNFIRFADTAKDGSAWYRENVDWIWVDGKIRCAKEFGEDAEVYSVIDYVKPETNAPKSDKVVYVMIDSGEKGRVFYTLDSQTGEKSRVYTSYQSLIFSEQLYRLSTDGRTRFYPARLHPQNNESILRRPLPIREHGKYIIQKATDNGYKTEESGLDLIDYNMEHDYYVFHDEKRKGNFLRFVENGSDPKLDIKLPAEIDLTKPISLDILVEHEPFNFAKLPTFEFGSRENIEKFLDAVVRGLEAKKLTNSGKLDKDAIKSYEEYAQEISTMIDEKISAEASKIEAQEQGCWEQKEQAEGQDSVDGKKTYGDDIV